MIFNSAMGSAGGTSLTNCRVAYGQYTGSGTYGSSNPNKLTFDGKPLMVWVREKTKSVGNSSEYLLTMVRDTNWSQAAEENYYYTNTITWGDDSVSWYSTQAGSGQYNTSGKTFCYVALLEVEE